jgi:hypothetical protein
MMGDGIRTSLMMMGNDNREEGGAFKVGWFCVIQHPVINARVTDKATAKVYPEV